MALYNLVYTSKAARDGIVDGTAPVIDDILATSRRWNDETGVRGALLFTEGRFVQALEGEKQAVKTTFQHIAADARHKDVEVLCAQPCAQPRFSDWSMAFVGDAPLLRERYADAPLADVVKGISGDALLDLMLDIARRPD